jgi:hypothetical protein
VKVTVTGVLSRTALTLDISKSPLKLPAAPLNLALLRQLMMFGVTIADTTAITAMTTRSSKSETPLSFFMILILHEK